MDRLRRIVIISFFFGAWLWFAAPSQAAERNISFSQPVGLVRVGDYVSVDILLTNLDQAMNAVDLLIRFPADRLEVVAVSRTQSALTLWPEPPKIDAVNGTVQVVGGVPNGLYAKDARVVTLIMTALTTGAAQLEVDTSVSVLLLNDGVGTRVTPPPSTTTLDVVSDFTPVITVISRSHPLLNTWYQDNVVLLTWERQPETQYSYAFSLDGQPVADDIPDEGSEQLTFPDLTDGRYSFTIKSRSFGGAWSAITQRWFLIDRTPPEAFTLEQLPPSTVDGRTVLAWSAVDAASDVISSLRVGNIDQGNVDSPLTILTAWSGKTITMTLTDLAGNTRTSSWTPPNTGSANRQSWVIYVLLGLMAGAAATFVVRRRRR